MCIRDRSPPVYVLIPIFSHAVPPTLAWGSIQPMPDLARDSVTHMIRVLLRGRLRTHPFGGYNLHVKTIGCRRFPAPIRRKYLSPNATLICLSGCSILRWFYFGLCCLYCAVAGTNADSENWGSSDVADAENTRRV